MERVSTFGEEHWVVRFSGQTARLGGVLNREAAPSTNCAHVRTTRRALTAGLRLRIYHGFVFRREQVTPSSAELPVRTGGVSVRASSGRSYSGLGPIARASIQSAAAERRIGRGWSLPCSRSGPHCTENELRLPVVRSSIRLWQHAWGRRVPSVFSRHSWGRASFSGNRGNGCGSAGPAQSAAYEPRRARIFAARSTAKQRRALSSLGWSSGSHACPRTSWRICTRFYAWGQAACENSASSQTGS